MTQHARHILGITLGALALVMLTAGASALITRDVVTPDEPKTVTKVVHTNTTNTKPAPQQPQKVAAKCDDGNVVGYGLGALAGGLIGNQVGDGDGKKVATVAGAAGGALAGGQYIPTRGVLCPK